jgi:predicted RNA-binding Zn ribbon-like protein
MSLVDAIGSHGEVPASCMSFVFRSGRPSLDFAATLGGRYRQPVERLAEPADLTRWLRQSGVIDISRDPTEAQLAAAKDLREVIYRIAVAVINGTPLGWDDTDLLNHYAAFPPVVRVLRPDRSLGRLAADPVAAALSSLARDAIELVSGDQAARLRECATPGCSLLFVDTSRSGVRRWCSMATCGNQDKVQRYRQRAQLSSL